jgi:hypothetical protein
VQIIFELWSSYKLGAGKVPEMISHAPRFVKTMSLNCVSSLLNEIPGLPRPDCKFEENRIIHLTMWTIHTYNCFSVKVARMMKI